MLRIGLGEDARRGKVVRQVGCVL